MSLVSASRVVAAAVVLAMTCLGCSKTTVFGVQYASNYAPPTGSISVLGVYENGRLNSDSWREIGPALSQGYGKSQCESAWTEQFYNANHPLAEAVDDYTKDGGISDSLLDRLAPMAKGASILTLSVQRLGPRVPKEGEPKSRRGPPITPTSMRSSSQAGMRATGWARPTLSDVQARDASEAVFDISAQLFSIQQRRSLVVVTMNHRGADLDQALQQFSAKLREVMPNVSCTGWNYDAKVDVAGIRALLSQRAPEAEPEPGLE